MHQGLSTTAQRTQRLLEQRIKPAVVAPAITFKVEATEPAFEPCSFDEAISRTFREFRIGDGWAPAWHTTWFRLTAQVPHEWAGCEVVAHLDLGFFREGDGFQAEGLVYRDGRIVHALQPDRRLVVLLDEAVGGESVELYVEAVANPVITGDLGSLAHGPTVMGDPRTAPDRPIYRLRRAELGVHQRPVAALALEVHLLLDLLLDLASDDPLRPKVVRALDELGAALDLDDVVGTAEQARVRLAPIFDVPSAPGAHRVIAVGHAHLDTAWLWPLRETRRKVLRTFANALDLLDRYPDHRYAHSQAVHYAWIEAAHPELFARVQERVAAGQWEPVGGMWVEADLNLSGGESLVRQALHGQRAFERWFGRRSTVGFLPDDFGYPAALPQILRRAGFTSFFTQKLSWNETNRFPHHTFWWEGLDGSRLFTHFSPVDTYNSVLTPGELRFAARNFTDHGGASTSLVLFGHGDGGGGPTAAMVERARRLADVQGVPAVSLGSVEQFFADALAEYGDRAATWVGEMYLEKHRGTFTSQVRTKQGNVRNERLLREAEIWSVASDAWPGAQLEHLWHEVLVQQFHDILPGSSIAWVHQDAEAIHADVTERCEAIIASALDGSTPVLANPAAVTLDGVVVLEGEAPAGAQPLGAGRYALRAVVPALAGVELSDAVAPHAADVVVSQQPDSTVVENGIVSLRWDGRGRLVGYDDMRAGRSLLPGGPAAWSGLVVRPDQPAEFDAWDIDERDARHPGERLDDPVALEVVASGPLLATVRVTHRWRRSLFVHEVTITADSARVDHVLIADWHEDERRVSFELPLALHAREATCGVQFGHVRRPRHHNTSWDAARFESCAHRFVHIGEHGFGAAILFAGPRGVDVQGEGVALSLLRAPRYPDPGADRGHQEVRWSTWSHIGDPFLAGLEDEAQRVGHPPRLAGRPVAAVVRHELPGVVVEAVKRAEDGSGDVIVRLWESRGGRSSGRLGLGLGTVDAAWSCNLLEDNERALDVCDGEVSVELAPFELATLRLRACAQGTS